MKLGFCIIMLSILFTGCVSTKNVKIPENEFIQMKGKTIVTTVSEKPDFAAMTAGKAMFAMVGAAAMIYEGNQIIKNNNVQDPANYIGEKLATELSAKNSLNISSINNIESSDGIDELSNKYSDKDYILDVRTINWSFAYFPTDWDNYRVIYSVKLRLIDTKNSNLIAEGFCSNVPDQTENSPSHDELLANDAQRLKNELQLSADKCLSQFNKEIFSL